MPKSDQERKRILSDAVSNALARGKDRVEGRGDFHVIIVKRLGQRVMISVDEQGNVHHSSPNTFDLQSKLDAIGDIDTKTWLTLGTVFVAVVAAIVLAALLTA